MNLPLIISAVLFVWASVVLARAIRADGLGARPGPRSHHEELGSWVDQELGR